MNIKSRLNRLEAHQQGGDHSRFARLRQIFIALKRAYGGGQPVEAPTEGDLLRLESDIAAFVGGADER